MIVMIDESLNLTTQEAESALKRAFLPIDPDKWTEDMLDRVDEVLNNAQQAKIERILAHRARHAQGV